MILVFKQNFDILFDACNVCRKMVAAYVFDPYTESFSHSYHCTVKHVLGYFGQSWCSECHCLSTLLFTILDVVHC